MRTDFLLLSAAFIASADGLPPAVKRQGLFSCSGWGASCMSGWSWRQRGQPTGQQLPGTNKHKLVTPPRISKPKYWLTTDRTWGPMGKRSNRENLPSLLNALLQYDVVDPIGSTEDQHQISDFDRSVFKNNLVTLFRLYDLD